MKQIFFRVDSSLQIGSGHLMRCLTLASQIKNKAKIVFISRGLEGNMNRLISQNGFDILQLPNVELNSALNGYEKWLMIKLLDDAEQTKDVLESKSVDLIIIDHYAIDEMWEKQIRPYVKKIMVIDDLANRKHDCDILLDQNYYKSMNGRYQGLIPEKCKLLLGPRYALLREEFYEAKNFVRERDGIIKNILVFFGGSDLTNETMKVLRAIATFKQSQIIVNVVVGGSNPYKEEIKRYCEQHDTMKYYCQIDYIARLMNEADLAIGAGGSTTWERCFLGLPAIVIAIADNQIAISQDCADAGYIKYLGTNDSVSEQQICIAMKEMTRERLINFQKKSQLGGEKIDWFKLLFASSNVG